MWSVFMIPVAGAALAALALLMEWVYYRQYYKSEWRWLCAGSSQEWWQQFTASCVRCQPALVFDIHFLLFSCSAINLVGTIDVQVVLPLSW
jgi:hypothetical protein